MKKSVKFNFIYLIGYLYYQYLIKGRNCISFQEIIIELNISKQMLNYYTCHCPTFIENLSRCNIVISNIDKKSKCFKIL